MSLMTTDTKPVGGDKEEVEVQPLQGMSGQERQVQKSLLKKLDLLVLPLLALSYLMAYLVSSPLVDVMVDQAHDREGGQDRNNIGYARLMGLQEGLEISDQHFYNIIMVFYSGYLVCVFAGNLLIRKVGPKVMLGSAVVVFGLIVCCMTEARGYGDLIGLRFGVGCAEALLQSTPLYMAIWYGRDEIGKRVGKSTAGPDAAYKLRHADDLVAIFYSATTISGVFSGLISYGVQKDLEEYNAQTARFEPKQIVKSLLDPKTYLLAILSGTNATLLACTGAFLPTIVNEFGYSKVDAQLFTIIPYACAFFSMLAIGFLSDYYRNKSWFILGSLASCVLGLVILISTAGKEVGMLGACLLVAGTYPSSVLQIAWIQMNSCGNTKRAISWGFAMIVAQGMSMSGAQIYTRPPRYFEGHGILLGFVVLAMTCTIAARALMARANTRKDREVSDYERRGEGHPGVGLSFEETCDDHINFRYIL
ncbi:hypothetical protein CLAIMM_05801 [Cladophialophora immunda]|nr:hypothetical protein CLAIMM_05801 [Cladophialophora immunda]